MNLFETYKQKLKKENEKRIFHFSLFTFHLRSVMIFSFSLFTFHFSSAQQLETFIEEALENNPVIQKFELQYKIAKEKVKEVQAIPNTEFGVGYFLSEPETRTGAQRFKLSAKQMIPWFGTITSRENYVSSLAAATYEEIVIAKGQLITTVSQSYYNLYANKATQDVVVETINLLETYETLALTAVEVDKASAVDVLRLQMRQNELEELQQVLIQQYLAEQTNFNNLLNREDKVPVTVDTKLSIPSEAVEITPENLAVHPELLQFEKRYIAIQKSELLNQKESNPMIGFGLDYINVEARSAMNFSDNGKDIIMPMVAVSIPIFNKTYKSKTKQNTLQQQEILSQKQERLNKLETLLDKAIKDRISSKISFNTQVKNLEQAKNAEEILIKSYETGRIDFNDVLDIQELQLKFQMKQIEAVKTYYMQTTQINYLTQQ